MKKLPLYTVEDDDVTKISLVSEPAIESGLVYFKSDKPVYVSLDTDEKHLIYAPVLRPDFPIYRKYDDQEFYIAFSRNAVERSCHDFLKRGFQHQWSVEHEQDVKGLSVVESWIKMSQSDKSVELGLQPDLEIGTWFVGLSVENEAVWTAVKEGRFTGLSIEAFVYIDDDKFSKIKKEDMTEQETKLETVEVNESFWDKLKAIITSALGRPEIPAEEAEAEAEEVVEEIKEEETPTEENLEEETSVEEVAEDAAAAAEEIAEEAATDPDEEKAALEETISKLEEKVEALNEEIETLRKENQKLSKQPSAKEIKAGANNRSQADTMAILRQLREGSYFKR